MSMSQIVTENGGNEDINMMKMPEKTWSDMSEDFPLTLSRSQGSLPDSNAYSPERLDASSDTDSGRILDTHPAALTRAMSIRSPPKLRPTGRLKKAILQIARQQKIAKNMKEAAQKQGLKDILEAPACLASILTKIKAEEKTRMSAAELGKHRK